MVHNKQKIYKTNKWVTKPLHSKNPWPILNGCDNKGNTIHKCGYHWLLTRKGPQLSVLPKALPSPIKITTFGNPSFSFSEDMVGTPKLNGWLKHHFFQLKLQFAVYHGIKQTHIRLQTIQISYQVPMVSKQYVHYPLGIQKVTIEHGPFE